MATRVRHLKESDIDAVLRLQAACYAPQLRELAPAFLSKMKLSPTTCYAVELENTDLVAYGIAFPWDDAQPPELNTSTARHHTMNTLYIHDIAVEPSMQRTGLGKQIFEHMKRDAAGLYLPTITLTAVDGAVNHWLRQGFQEIPDVVSGYGERARRMRMFIRP
jgi:GNAT superfamily N-acetyltransferase